MQHRFEKKRLAIGFRAADFNLKVLLQLTVDPRWDLRGAVCEQIGELSGLSEQEVDSITDRMLTLADDKNWYVRRAAWRTLGRLDLSTRSQVKVFYQLESQIKAINSDARELVYRVFEIISWKEYLKDFIHGPIFFHWLQNQIQTEPDQDVYIAGLQLLKTLLPDDELQKKIFFSILKPINNECPVRREAIFQLLGTVEWPVSLMEAVASTLIYGINDRVPYVASAACKSLINLSWPDDISSKLVQYFLESLQHPRSLALLREFACEGLGKLVLSFLENTNHSLVFESILIRTIDDIPSVRSAAWKTLAKYPCSIGMQSNLFNILQQRSKNPECPWHLLMDCYRTLGDFPWSKEFKARAQELLAQAVMTIIDPYISAVASQSLAALSSNLMASPIAPMPNQNNVKLSSFWDRFFISKVELKASKPVNSFALK